MFAFKLVGKVSYSLRLNVMLRYSISYAKVEIKFDIDMLHSYSRCCIPTKKGVAFL